MQPTRLSVGIPVYNQAATIAQTLASALNQTSPFDEVVVSENYSTDDTARCLEPFESRIRIVRPPCHLSMADNWNFCVGQLRNPWFSLLSGDDLLQPGFAASIRTAIEAHHDASLIRTDWDVIDAQGQVSSVRHQLSVSRITRPPKTWTEQLYGPKVSFAGFAARRDHWQEVGGFAADFYLFQDWMYWLKIAPLGTFVRIPERLAQYRCIPRPQIDRERIPQRISDEHRYLTEILPSLPWQRMDRHRMIRAVRRRKLQELLTYLVPYADVLNTEPVRVKLQDLAESCDRTDLFLAWCRKPRPIDPSLQRRVAMALKQGIRRLLN